MNYLGSRTFWEEYQQAQAELHDWLTYALIANDNACAGWSRAYRDAMRRIYTA